MWGAVIGDLAGSIYEYNETLKFAKLNPQEIITENAFYSDDTILTVVVLDAVLHDRNYNFYLKKYAKDFMNYKPNFEPYFKSIFLPGFTKWTEANQIGNSKGNGAMMRISSIGYLFNTETEIIENAIKATIPSHNSPEAIESDMIIALIIYNARIGLSKEEIIKKLNLEFKYKPFTKFNLTCKETIDNCLYALFTSNSFNEALKTVISYGGDTDTNACIVGSMAEALYKIEDNLIQKAKQKIPEEFVGILDQGYSKVLKLSKI